MTIKKLSQKDAVFEIIKAVLGSLYSSDIPMRPMFSSERMNKAVELFISKIKSGEIERPKRKSINSNAHYDSEYGVRKYARNIIFNWLNKDLRLNGGEKYDPSKSRESIFERDSIIKQLNILQRGIQDAVILKEINKTINDRKKQLAVHEGSLYLVSKCITDEPLQNLIKNLISAHHGIKEPFLNMNSLQDIEHVIIKIIDLCKKELIHEVLPQETKKSA